MNILLYDAMQDAKGVPAALKSAALADTYTPVRQSGGYDLELTLPEHARTVNCVGLAGLASAGRVELWQYSWQDSRKHGLQLAGQPLNGTYIRQTREVKFTGNGLYLFAELKFLAGQKLYIAFRAQGKKGKIGRLAVGKALSVGLSKAREPGWKTTAKSRRTLSGQVIPGVGGYTYRTLSCEIKYKIDVQFLDDLERAYPRQISKGLPVFVEFPEKNLPCSRMYAQLPLEYVLQNSTIHKLYSAKIELQEAF